MKNRVRPELDLPHLRFIFGEWRASQGIDHAVGASPQEAYERLLEFRQKRNAEWQNAYNNACQHPQWQPPLYALPNDLRAIL